MKILTDREIKERNIIVDGVDHKVSTTPGGVRCASYGLEPLGYTFRCSAEGDSVPTTYMDEDGREFFYLPAGKHATLFTVESVDMPDNVTILNFTGKSTYVCRNGCIMHSTQVEPGFKGKLVFGITNLQSDTVKIYIGEGILQANFIETDRPETTYEGHYQGSVAKLIDVVNVAA